MALSYNEVKYLLDLAAEQSGGRFQGFDASYYASQYGAAVAGFEGDLLQHYVEVGAALGYAPNAWFDAAYYRGQYNDLVDAGLSGGAGPLAHYALKGVNEGRSPNAALALNGFDYQRYIADVGPALQDYIDANIDDFGGSVANGAMAHYVKYGIGEGRKAYDYSGHQIAFSAVPKESFIAGVQDGNVTTVALDTNDGQTQLKGNNVQVDGGDGTSVLRLTGDADIRIDVTNSANQVKAIDLNGDGRITNNGVENNVSGAKVATFKNFEVFDAYSRNPLNEFDATNNFLGNLTYSGTGYGGDGVSTNGNIVLGGLGYDLIHGGIGNDFLVGGNVSAQNRIIASSILGDPALGELANMLLSYFSEGELNFWLGDILRGGRNADFFFGEFSTVDDVNAVSVYDGGTTSDDLSAGAGQSSQDNDWVLVEVTDDEEYAVVDLGGGWYDNDTTMGGIWLNDGQSHVARLVDIENVDASGNLYGFLDDFDVELGGRRYDTRDGDGVANYGLGSSGQLRIYGSYEDNILIGGYDNDLIYGEEGDDILMGGNMQFLLETVLGGRTNPNLLAIVNDGRDELRGGDGDDHLMWEADGGIYDGGDTGGDVPYWGWISNDSMQGGGYYDWIGDGDPESAYSDTLWLTKYALGTQTADDLTTDGVLRFDLGNGRQPTDRDNENDFAMDYKGYGGADALAPDGWWTADQSNYKDGVVRTEVTDIDNVIATGLGQIDYRAAGTNNPELDFANQQNFKAYHGDLDLRGSSGYLSENGSGRAGGDNILYASSGNDTIEGREGNDSLSGGNGSDDFYFSLVEGEGWYAYYDNDYRWYGEDDGGDGVDVIHRQTDADGDNLWDRDASGNGLYSRDFDIGGSQELFDSTFTLGLPDVLAPYVDGVRFVLGGATYEVSGLAAATVAEWKANLEEALGDISGLEGVVVAQASPNQIVLTDPSGRAFEKIPASGWLLTGGGLPSDGIDQWSQTVGAPQGSETRDRIIYKAYEDRSDNEGVDDNGITGSTVSLGRDSYAQDLVVGFSADGTRLAEDQTYRIDFQNLTTEDKVKIEVNGVVYELQVGVSIDGNLLTNEDGRFASQAAVQANFLARMAGFINSFMDENTAAGAINAMADGTGLIIGQRAYNGEETVFMFQPVVTLTNLSGGERPSSQVTNISQHELHLLDYIASSLGGQLERSTRYDGSEAALNSENVLFIGEEFVNRSTLQTALDSGETIYGHESVVINGRGDDLMAHATGIEVVRNQATTLWINSDNGPAQNGNFSVHGDDYLIGGQGNDAIYGGTGDDRVRGSLGNDVVDGGKDLYAVRVAGQAKYRVEVLNAYEAGERVKDADVLDIYLISQTETGYQEIDGANFVPYFQDTLIFHQADFAPGQTRFTINLNDYEIESGTGRVLLTHGGAGVVTVDVNGDGVVDATTTFTNFENIRTVSGVGHAVAGDGQGMDTLILTGLSNDTDGIRFNLTNDGNGGLVQADIDKTAGVNYTDIIRVDGVETVIGGLGRDVLLIDETEAAKDNRFEGGDSLDSGGAQIQDEIQYHNNFGDPDVEPTVKIVVESSANTDQVIMTGGRVGLTVATDTLVSVERIGLQQNTAQGIREDDVLDTTHVNGAVIDQAAGTVSSGGARLVTIAGLDEVENIVAGPGGDTLIVADAAFLGGNARADAASTDLTIDTYLNFDKLGLTPATALDRQSIADLRANNPGAIPEARNFEEFKFDLGQGKDRVDYSTTNDRVAALVAVNAATNYVLVDGDLDGSYDDAGDRVDALKGVEEIVASKAESILDFTALGQDVRIDFQFDETRQNLALDRLESTVRIGDGVGNTIAGIPNFIEYYDLNKNPAVPAFGNAAWTRIEGSDFAESVFYDGSEDLVTMAGVDHRYTDDVLNLRGGSNNVSYFALETSITAVVDVKEFVAGDPLNTGLITATIDFQDGSSGSLAGAGQHVITSYTGDNGIAAGSLKLEASQDAEDSVTFQSDSSKLFLLGRSSGVIDVEIGDLPAMRLTGFEELLDADSDDVYDMANLAALVSSGFTLTDNLTDDRDTIKVGSDAVGFAGAPAKTISLEVLNDEFGFDFDVLDASAVTTAGLMLVGDADTLAVGRDTTLNPHPLDGDADDVILGALDNIASIALFQDIILTDASIASASNAVVLDTAANQLRSAGVTIAVDVNAIGLDATLVTQAVDLSTTGPRDVFLWGSDFADTITGGGGNDEIWGGLGADILDGGTAAEVREIELFNLLDPLGGGTVSVEFNGAAYSVTISEGTEIVDGAGRHAIGSALAAAVNADLAGINAGAGWTNGELVGASYDSSTGLLRFTFSNGADVLDAEDVAVTFAGDGGTFTASAQTVVTQGGGGGIDTFIYAAAAESTASSMDQIFGFIGGLGGDVIDLGLIDVDPNTLAEDAFVGVNVVNAAAADFAALSGLAGAAFAGVGNDVYVGRTATDAYVFVDVDQSDSYGAGDLVIKLVGVTDVSMFTAVDNFVL